MAQKEVTRQDVTRKHGILPRSEWHFHELTRYCAEEKGTEKRRHWIFFLCSYLLLQEHSVPVYNLFHIRFFYINIEK